MMLYVPPFLIQAFLLSPTKTHKMYKLIDFSALGKLEDIITYTLQNPVIYIEDFMVNNNDACTLLRMPTNEELAFQSVSVNDVKNLIHPCINYKEMVFRVESGKIENQTNPKLLPEYMIPQNAHDMIKNLN